MQKLDGTPSDTVGEYQRKNYDGEAQLPNLRAKINIASTHPASVEQLGHMLMPSFSQGSNCTKNALHF